MSEEKIEIREIQPDDFKKGILSGEILPHNVELIINFSNGKSLKRVVCWNEITDFYKYHNLCVVGEYYQLMVDFNL